MARSCGEPTWFGADDIVFSHAVWSAALIAASKRCSSGVGGAATDVPARAIIDAPAAAISGFLIPVPFDGPRAEVRA